jgi:hypothetical protein
VVAVRDLALGAVEGLVALGLNDPWLTVDALAAVANRLQEFSHTKAELCFNVVMDTGAQGGHAANRPSHQTIVIKAEPA